MIWSEYHQLSQISIDHSNKKDKLYFNWLVNSEADCNKFLIQLEEFLLANEKKHQTRQDKYNRYISSNRLINILDLIRVVRSEKNETKI